MSLNLCLPILDSSQYISLSNAGQHSRKRCCSNHQCNCFIDYFDDPIPDLAVIYTGDIPFQDNEKEGMHTTFLGNPTGNIFLSASRDHELY